MRSFVGPSRLVVVVVVVGLTYGASERALAKRESAKVELKFERARTCTFGLCLFE